MKMSNFVRMLRNLWPPLTLAVTLVVGCRKAPTPQSNPPAPKVALQTAGTSPIADLASEDCGLARYPVSRSNSEIVADVPRDTKKPPNEQMVAKIAIDKDGKITHLRVLRLAHPNAPNWREINESALDSVKRFHYKPTIYEGRPVAVCSDVSVIVDLF